MKLAGAIMLAAAIVTAVGVALASGHVLASRAANALIEQNVQSVATSWMDHLGAELEDFSFLQDSAGPTADQQATLGAALSFGDVYRFSLFDGEGRLVMVSDDAAANGGSAALGGRDPRAEDAIALGRRSFELVDGRDDPDRPDWSAELYLPAAVAGPLGAIRLELDVTEMRASGLQAVFRLGVQVALVSLAAVAIPSLVVAWLWRRLRLSMRDLAMTRDAALVAERSKTQFLANMSHEIRTPMNGIIGITDLLADTDLDGQQRTYAGIIAESANALLSIINDVLEFSRLGAGKTRLDERPFKVSRVVHCPAAALSKIAHDKGVELAVRIDPALPRYATGDPDRIAQVMTNLIGNAVKFTAAGEVIVTLSREIVGEDRARLRVEVSDTGIGIPADKLESVFDTFSQVDDSSTRKHEGTGLGLAISRSLVELMGGEIGVASEVDRGSRFWFALPLRPAVGEEPALAPPRSIEGLRVLAIGDNATNRLIVGETLSSWRLDGVLAGSGEEGLQALRDAARSARRFDLVLLDHEMPRTDGVGVLDRIRRDPEIAATPVILLSALDRSGTDFAGGGPTPDAIVTKPVARSELFDRIVECLSQPPGGPAPGWTRSDPRSLQRPVARRCSWPRTTASTRWSWKPCCGRSGCATGRWATARTPLRRTGGCGPTSS